MKKFNAFILESLRREIVENAFFICKNVNFRNIKTKMEGKIIKNVGFRIGENYKYIYKFTSDENIMVIEDGVIKETRDFELTENQIRSLQRLSSKDLENFNNGIRLRYEASIDFIKVCQYEPKHIFYEWSYFDLYDDKNISYLSYIDDPNVPENEKYTSKLRKISPVTDVYNLIKYNKINDITKYDYVKSNYQIKYTNFIRRKQGLDVKFDCSSSFRFLLKDINFKVKYETYDIGFFDITNDDGTISFLPRNKIKDLEKNELYVSKNRQVSKIGRILKKLNDDYNEINIDHFVTKYKTEYNLKYKYDLNNIRVVTGDEITLWYRNSNYAKGNGTLNNSCMRYEKDDIVKRVEFYSKYPDKIALCILIDDNKKLLARSLIWRLDNPSGIIFMDRIYGITSHYENILKRYADVNKMQTRNDGFHISNDLEVIFENFKNKHKHIILPYLDTFKYSKTIQDSMILSNKTK